jgi:hypothetical protein
MTDGSKAHWVNQFRLARLRKRSPEGAASHPSLESPDLAAPSLPRCQVGFWWIDWQRAFVDASCSPWPIRFAGTTVS